MFQIRLTRLALVAERAKVANFIYKELISSCAINSNDFK